MVGGRSPRRGGPPVVEGAYRHPNTSLSGVTSSSGTPGIPSRTRRGDVLDARGVLLDRTVPQSRPLEDAGVVEYDHDRHTVSLCPSATDSSTRRRSRRTTRSPYSYRLPSEGGDHGPLPGTPTSGREHPPVRILRRSRLPTGFAPNPGRPTPPRSGGGGWLRVAVEHPPDIRVVAVASPVPVARLDLPVTPEVGGELRLAGPALHHTERSRFRIGHGSTSRSRRGQQ